MSVTTHHPTAPASRVTRPGRAGAMRAMLRSEARLLARNPGVVVWSTVLPVAAAIVLACIPAIRKPSKDLGGLSFFHVYQPILILFAITLLAVQSLPDVLTRYREMGVLKRLRTTPASPALLLFAQLTLTLLVSISCTVLMTVVPALVGASWPRNVTGFVVAYLLAAWALLGLGLLIASLFHNAKVAAGFGTVLFFVVEFFAGLWLQRPNMPDWLRHISDFTPGGAGAQALTDSAVGHWPRLLHLIVLAVWGVATAAASIRLFTWE
jgi:ABC-2 type transport system permease protein